MHIVEVLKMVMGLIMSRPMEDFSVTEDDKLSLQVLLPIHESYNIFNLTLRYCQMQRLVQMPLKFLSKTQARVL